MSIKQRQETPTGKLFLWGIAFLFGAYFFIPFISGVISFLIFLVLGFLGYQFLAGASNSRADNQRYRGK